MLQTYLLKWFHPVGMKGFDGAGPVCGLQAEAPDLVKTGNHLTAKNTGKAFNFGFANSNAMAIAA